MEKRKNLRLQGYDYSQNGAYFVTICTNQRKCILSSLRRGDPCGRPRIELSRLGRIVEEEMQWAAEKYDIKIDAYVIMPNHVHLIVVLENDPEAYRATARVAPTLGMIVGALKSRAANRWRDLQAEPTVVWQRGYYDHVIRDDKDYIVRLNYIDTNPDKWAEDKYFTT